MYVWSIHVSCDVGAYSTTFWSCPWGRLIRYPCRAAISRTQRATTGSFVSARRKRGRYRVKSVCPPAKTWHSKPSTSILATSIVGGFNSSSTESRALNFTCSQWSEFALTSSLLGFRAVQVRLVTCSPHLTYQHRVSEGSQLASLAWHSIERDAGDGYYEWRSACSVTTHLAVPQVVVLGGFDDARPSALRATECRCYQ